MEGLDAQTEQELEEMTNRVQTDKAKVIDLLVQTVTHVHVDATRKGEEQEA